MNSLTVGNVDFTVTPTGIVGGDMLMFRVAFAGVMIQEITKISILLDINPLLG